MRILRVSHWLYPDDIGGGEYHVHAMSRDQAAMGHDVTVLKTSSEVSTLRRDQRHGYEVVYCPATYSFLKNDISAVAAKRILSASDFDVIHAHSHFYFSTNLAALKRHFSDIPLAITNHSLYSQSAPERLFSYYLRTVGRWTLNSADIVFCYTEEERRKTQNLGVSSDINVISNGIDATQFHPNGPESQHIDPKSPSVLFVGRLVKGKGPHHAINTIRKVRDDHPDATLYIVGDGPLRSELESEITSKGLESNVELLGQVAYDEMPRIFRSSDILLLPSRAEGFPRVVMEAMASGTPVVCSDLEQVKRVVAEAGVTVPVGDVDGLSSSVTHLLDNPELRSRYGEQGRVIVENEFSWSDTVAKTTDELLQLAKC